MSQMQNDFQLVEDPRPGDENVLVARLCDPDVVRNSTLRRRHIEMLCISTVVMICAAILQTPDGHRVALPGMSNMPFPEICLTKAWFGIHCPGCGLTRSFISMMHGHWADAFAYHRIGPIFFLIVLSQFPYRIAGLLTHRAYPLGRRVAQATIWLLIGLLVGNWFVSFFI